MKKYTLFQYYRDYQINPVPIDVENKDQWALHCIKRRNLYERHLKIPVSYFRGRSVIEFGCNSGENALYLASLGARLTLVEPNEQVLPRFKDLFKKFRLFGNVVSIINTDIAGFKSNAKYDCLVAEGFINTIPEREKMFFKICGLLNSGGIGIVSFDDMYGSFFEVLRQFILKRICELNNISDFHSGIALNIARRLFAEDFARINTSRPFEAWFKDVLINPFVTWKYFWSYQEFIPLLEKAGCEFYSSSPKWSSVDHFSWYKNVYTSKARHIRLLEDWYNFSLFFLTGIPLGYQDMETVGPGVVRSVAKFIKKMSEYVSLPNSNAGALDYPNEFDKYLKKSKNKKLRIFNSEMKKLCTVLKSADPNMIASCYYKTKQLRNLWGFPGPYICFSRSKI